MLRPQATPFIPRDALPSPQDTRIERLENLNKACEDYNRDLRFRLSEAEDVIITLRKRVEDLEGESGDSISNLRSTDKAISTLRNRARKAESRVSSLTARLRSAENENQLLEGELNRLVEYYKGIRDIISSCPNCSDQVYEYEVSELENQMLRA